MSFNDNIDSFVLIYKSKTVDLKLIHNSIEHTNNDRSNNNRVNFEEMMGTACFI